MTDIEVSMVHNIDVEASGEACVDIKDFMESKYINVTTDQGTNKQRPGIHNIFVFALSDHLSILNRCLVLHVWFCRSDNSSQVEDRELVVKDGDW